jgi:MFS family permease
VTDQLIMPAADILPRQSRINDFNRLWLGQSISAFGSQITALALPLTAVIYLDASSIQVGLLATVRELAFVGLMLFFGVVVDRCRRRPLMIVSDLGRAVVIATVPIIAWLGSLQMTYLYVAAFLLGALAVVFSLAYRAYLPTLVNADELLARNSRLQATESLSDVAGPSLAGLLIQLMRAPFALVADAFSFLISALSIATIRTPETPLTATASADADMPEPGGLARRVFSEIWSGLTFTFGHPVLRVLAVASAIFNVFATIMLTIFVIYAIRIAHLSPGDIGLIFTGFGVGGVIAAASLSRTIKLGVGRLLAAGYVVGAGAIAVLPFIGGSTGPRTATLAAVFVVAGCAIVSANIVEMTIRQAVTPHQLQGRTAAGFGFLIGALTPLAALVAGVLGDQIGPRGTLIVAAIGVPMSVPWILLSRIPRIRSMESLSEAGRQERQA